MILTSVDLPAPFSPTSACTPPGVTSKVTSLSAREGPKDLLSPTTRNAGSRTSTAQAGPCDVRSAGFDSLALAAISRPKRPPPGDK